MRADGIGLRPFLRAGRRASGSRRLDKNRIGQDRMNMEQSLSRGRRRPAFAHGGAPA